MKPRAFKLWFDWILNLCEPHLAGVERRNFTGEEAPLGVAVQVALESKGLKPVSHFIGSRVETRRFQAWEEEEQEEEEEEEVEQVEQEEEEEVG